MFLIPLEVQFWFVITSIYKGIKEESVSHLSQIYQSDTFETVLISGLKKGEIYMFQVIAMAINIYGNSQAFTSKSVFAGAVSTSTTKERGSEF